MRKVLSGLVAIVLLAATPALAAPCKTSGTVDAPIAFPKNDVSDIAFARSMVPVMLPDTSGALPSSLSCTRSTVSTALGDYSIGGENGDGFPRMALRADGKTGPVLYLAGSPQATGTFALVIYTKGAPTVVKRFYAGIPTDQRLADDIRAALTDDARIMAYDPSRQLVAYGFAPAGGPPPPVTSGTRGDGAVVTAGPQVMIESTGDPDLLDIPADMRHRPSGFACPQNFAGMAVLLMSIDPRADQLVCNYRAGTDLTYRENDPIRYQIRLFKTAPGETTRSVFDQLTAAARSSLHITGDHTPPLATGAAPEPQFVAFWDTDGDGVQGVWVGKTGGWTVFVRAQYPPGAANDVEAGKIAAILFEQVGKQVK